jgi:AraC family transcriptional activator of tynA and feaB
LAQQVLEFISLAVRHAAGGDIAASSASRTLALARLKSAIDHNLSDPGLRPAAAAAAAGIGVRYANVLLAAEGSSLERYILDRRLCRSASMLSDPRQAGRAIGDIAYANGFDDPSHFGRAFKKRHGVSPRDFRKCPRSD